MPTFDYICEVCGAEGRAYRPDKPPRFCCRAHQKIGMAGKSTKPGKYPISPEVHEQIKELYQNITGKNQVKSFASKIGYPRWVISRYAIKQGWIAKTRKEPDWTDNELTILERSAHRSPEMIQRRLKAKGFKRSLTGIILKRKRMRLLKNLQGQSVNRLKECFGVDEKTIIRWIKLGHLKAKKRGTKRTSKQGGDIYYIKDKWVRDFVVNNVALIDFRKIDKYWLVDLLDDVYGCTKTEAIANKQKHIIDISKTKKPTEETCIDPEILEVFEEESNRYGVAAELW